MEIEEVIKVLKPIDNLLSDEMEFRDYRLIAEERPDLYEKEENQYHLLLWFNSDSDTSVRFWLYKDYYQIELSRNDRVISQDRKSISKLNPVILKYFIVGVEIHMDYINKMNNFKYLNVPKDFIREHRLGKVLD